MPSNDEDDNLIFEDEDGDPDEHDGWGRLGVGDHEQMKARVVREMCSTCIFRPGNQMQLRAGRMKQMVAETLRDQSFVICHSTLPGVARRENVLPAICRGFKDRYTTQALQLYERLFHGFLEVDAPSIHDDVPSKGGADEDPGTSGDAQGVPS